jgi:ATP-dependent protease ClpP protease subunit
VKISVKGPIIPSNYQWIYDWLGMEATSPKKISDQLAQANTENLEVEINSGGGSVFDASEIYTALRDYPGKVTGKIVGMAASAASVIAMAADNLLMAPTGQMMIHNASTISQGDYRDMDHTSEFLKNVNQSIANAYSLKSGKSYDELLSMMDKETWLTAQQALEHNLIDEVMFQDGVGVVASSKDDGLLPKQVIDKIRNELLNNRFNEPAATNQVAAKKEDNVKMDLEKLKNDYPELYKQIKNEGHQEGVQAENARFKTIDDIASPGFKDLVNKAKYETPITAEQLAVEMIKAQKQAGTNFLNARQEDAEPLNQVEGAAAPQNNQSEQEEMDKEAKAIANFVNQRRGIK